MAKEDFYRGSVATEYEQKRSGEPIWHKEDVIVESMLSLVRKGGATEVLDVPVGTGRFTSLYDKLGYRSIGFDVSDEMLRQAHARASSAGRLAVADIRQLPLGDGRVEAVVCIRFLHLVPRSTVKAAIAELSRVTRPGGFLIVSARLHGWDPSLAWQARVRFAFGRVYTLIRFQTGQANSRSHRRRWLLRRLRRVGLAVRDRQHVNRNPDGTLYEIFLLQSVGWEARRVRRPLSIEMFGLPGAGKSTLFDAVQDEPSLRFSDGFSAMDDLGFWNCVRARPIAALRLLIRLVPLWRELSQLPAKRAVVTGLRQLVAQSPSDTPICLFQEGVSHEVWRQLVRDGEISDTFLSRLLPVADLTVLVEAPLGVVQRRLATKRSPGPVSQDLMAEGNGGRLWDLGVSSYERVCNAIASGGGRTVVLRNDEDLETGAKKLTEIVLDFQRRRSH